MNAFSGYLLNYTSSRKVCPALWFLRLDWQWGYFLECHALFLLPSFFWHFLSTQAYSTSKTIICDLSHKCCWKHAWTKIVPVFWGDNHSVSTSSWNWLGPREVTQVPTATTLAEMCKVWYVAFCHPNIVGVLQLFAEFFPTLQTDLQTEAPTGKESKWRIVRCSFCPVLEGFQGGQCA